LFSPAPSLPFHSSVTFISLHHFCLLQKAHLALTTAMNFRCLSHFCTTNRIFLMPQSHPPHALKGVSSHSIVPVQKACNFSRTWQFPDTAPLALLSPPSLRAVSSQGVAIPREKYAPTIITIYDHFRFYCLEIFVSLKYCTCVHKLLYCNANDSEKALSLPCK